MKEVRRDKERKGMGARGHTCVIAGVGSSIAGDISLPALNKGMVGYGREGALSLGEETCGGDSGNRRAGEQKGGGEEAAAKGWRAMEERRKRRVAGSRGKGREGTRRRRV